MIGGGNMGSNMSLLFAEHGVEVHFYDPSEQNVHILLDQAKATKNHAKVVHQKDYKSLCESLDKPKVFVLSIPHGSVADKTIEGLRPYLEKGDVIMDASNEHWERTERRQRSLDRDGIHYIGMGVSGGYQSARHGPSISPGGSLEALDLVMPFLEKVAAKDKQGRPCVKKLGPGGCGHYVKMVHNGIEQGMMSTLCEVWFIMNRCLGMKYEDIGKAFEEWNKSGPLVSASCCVFVVLLTPVQYANFLVSIGADICRTKDPKSGGYVLANVRDKVVQDVDDTEGTGTWTCEEGVRQHVPIPTIAAAHLFRLASADAARRRAINKSFNGGAKVGSIVLENPQEKALSSFVEDLHMATYASFLMAFAQGLHVIKKADREHKWGLNFTSIIQLWRGGCIIQSDYIADLLERVYHRGDHDDDDLLSNREIGDELGKAIPSLKNVVLKSLEANANIPSLSASLEYYKYSGSTELPTQFMEAELDYFGHHMYDLKSEGPGKPVIGKRHFEWRPAKGIFEKIDQSEQKP
jgi:6-phosphogluconate dehydrogenase